jgi:hypothetical protein
MYLYVLKRLQYSLFIANQETSKYYYMVKVQPLKSLYKEYEKQSLQSESLNLHNKFILRIDIKLDNIL